MKSVRLLSVLAVAIAAMFCISVVSMNEVSAEDVDNDQGTVTYYTYTVNFQFQGTDAQSILWEFGFNDANGNPVTSTEWNPSGIVFPAKGTYTVVQTVSNSVGSYVSQLKICIMGTPEITFESNGGSEVQQQTVKVGNKIVQPSDPLKDGYVFSGWYKESSLLNRYDFSQTVSQHMTLYAKWTAQGSSGTDDGNDGDGGDNGNDNDGKKTESSDDSGFGLNSTTVSAAAIIIGILIGIIGGRSESKFLLCIGVVLALAGAVCLVTGYDVLGALGIGEAKE